MFKDQSAVSIIDGLTKGSITFNQIDEYKKLLAEYPENPFVNRLFADFLSNERSYVNAIPRYRKAYKLFMDEGETLQAISSLLELWKIIAPVPHDFRVLHSNLRRKNSHSSHIAEFFAKMSYPELRDTISCLEKIQVQNKDIIQNHGDPEDAIYYVISGELLKSPVGPGSDPHNPMQILKANDHFGDYFPYEVKRPAPYQVRAECNTELLKISKKDLLTLFEKHPSLKIFIKKLSKFSSIPDAEKPEKFFRKTSRRHLAISLYLDIINPEPGCHPLTVKGLSEDFSLGGARIIVDSRYQDIPCNDIINRKTRLRVSLPDESITVTIMGKIAWCCETEIDGHPTHALGVKFNETPAKLRGSMIIFINAVGNL